MIPLSDSDTKLRTTPFVTGLLVGLNVLVFLYQLSLNDVESFMFTYKLGAIPAEVLGSAELTTIPVLVGSAVRQIDVHSPVPTWTTVFTSMFMHGGFMHIGGNMLFLWVFGRMIEDLFGHIVYLFFYLIAGTMAVFAQSWLTATSTVPMVGASGAVAGVLGAYFLLNPFARINTLIVMGIITTIRIPAIALLGFWAVLQLFNSIGSLGPQVSTGGVAYFAHLGGFLFGLIVVAGYRLTIRGRRVASLVARAPRTWLGKLAGTSSRKGVQHWSSVSCPGCGSNELDYIDPPVRRWRCRRCDRVFR